MQIQAQVITKNSKKETSFGSTYHTAKTSKPKEKYF